MANSCQVCDGTFAFGESRHRIPGASIGQPTEPCFKQMRGLWTSVHPGENTGRALPSPNGEARRGGRDQQRETSGGAARLPVGKNFLKLGNAICEPVETGTGVNRSILVAPSSLAAFPASPAAVRAGARRAAWAGKPVTI